MSRPRAGWWPCAATAPTMRPRWPRPMSGVALNLGTAAAREAGNMIDLDSDPLKLMAVIRAGQASVDDAPGADHVLDRQRPRQILRRPAGAVRGGVSRAGRAQRHASREPGERDPLGRDLQRPDHHHGADPTRACAGCATAPATTAALLHRNLLVYGARRLDRAVHRHQGTSISRSPALAWFERRRCEPYDELR